MYLLLCPPQRLQSKNLFGLLLVRHPYISTDYVVKTQELVVAFMFFSISIVSITDLKSQNQH
jgi:hypothetical protein